MDRNEAIQLIRGHVKGEFLFKHMLATEAIMRATARELGEDEEAWGMAGLCHDIDFEETKENVGEHGLIAQKHLAGKLPEASLRAIEDHSYFLRGAPEPTDRMSIALLAADAITGLIIAAALVKPDKKLSSVTTESVANAFKKKGFAAGSNREQIKRMESAGMKLERFYEISLKAMQGIAGELGL
ncbi:MAG: HDIG domain-containing protein [Candidatus ainarchaeum sp.]|nr:HDIG domain-containing protein [Candidatus ainarchaeum sp.]